MNASIRSVFDFDETSPQANRARALALLIAGLLGYVTTFLLVSLLQPSAQWLFTVSVVFVFATNCYLLLLFHLVPITYFRVIIGVFIFMFTAMFILASALHLLSFEQGLLAQDANAQSFKFFFSVAAFTFACIPYIFLPVLYFSQYRAAPYGDIQPDTSHHAHAAYALEHFLGVLVKIAVFSASTAATFFYAYQQIQIMLPLALVISVINELTFVWVYIRTTKAADEGNRVLFVFYSTFLAFYTLMISLMSIEAILSANSALRPQSPLFNVLKRYNADVFLLIIAVSVLLIGASQIVNQMCRLVGRTSSSPGAARLEQNTTTSPLVTAAHHHHQSQRNNQTAAEPSQSEHNRFAPVKRKRGRPPKHQQGVNPVHFTSSSLNDKPSSSLSVDVTVRDAQQDAQIARSNPMNGHMP